MRIINPWKPGGKVFVIVTYDVDEKRVNKVRKHLKKYLIWVQNSVFECKLDAAQCRKLELDLEKLIDTDQDSLRFYYLGKSKDMKVKHIGIKEAYDLDGPIII